MSAQDRVARRSPNWAALGFVAGIHLFAIVALLQMRVVRESVMHAAAPLFVSIVPPERPAPVEARVVAPKPVVHSAPRPVPFVPPPDITPDTPSPFEITRAPEAAPVDPVPIAPVTIAAPAREAPPAPITPPSFTAAYLDNPPPLYPSLSRRAGETGKVMLRVLVSVEGRAAAIEIAASSGFPRLDRAASDAVARWRFVPAKRGDVALEAWVLVPIAFQLDR